MDDIENVQTLIDVGEWILVFETLCTQIHKWGIGLDPRIIHDREDLGASLNARAELTEHLWEDAVQR